MVRRFAGALGMMAKTDVIDARVIAHLAATIESYVRTAPHPKTRELKNLIIRRRQLLDMRTMDKNRLQIMPKALTERIRRHINALADDVRELDALIDSLVGTLAHWRKRRELLLSMPGVGAVVAHTFIAELPELGKLNNTQVAALIRAVGAPMKAHVQPAEGREARSVHQQEFGGFRRHGANIA